MGTTLEQKSRNKKNKWLNNNTSERKMFFICICILILQICSKIILDTSKAKLKESNKDWKGDNGIEEHRMEIPPRRKTNLYCIYLMFALMCVCEPWKYYFIILKDWATDWRWVIYLYKIVSCGTTPLQCLI